MRFRFLVVGFLLAIVTGTVLARETILPMITESAPVTLHVTSGAVYWAALFNPAAPDTDAVHSVYEASSLQDTTYTFTANESALLDYPRTVDVTVSGTAANIDVGTATITGTNSLDETITDTYSFTENTAGTLAGTKAFKTISTLAVHQQDGANVHVSVGLGNDFGMPMTNLTNGVVFADVDGTRESTPPTVAVSGTAIESNTIAFNTAPNGTKDFSYVVLVSPYRVTTSDTR